MKARTPTPTPLFEQALTGVRTVAPRGKGAKPFSPRALDPGVAGRAR